MNPTTTKYTWSDIRRWAMLNVTPGIQEIAFEAEKGDVNAWLTLEREFLNQNATQRLERVPE